MHLNYFRVFHNFAWIISPGMLIWAVEILMSAFVACELKVVSLSGIGFNGAETNCGIADILGIPLMSSYDIKIFRATTICCLSSLNFKAPSTKLKFLPLVQSLLYDRLNIGPLQVIDSKPPVETPFEKLVAELKVKYILIFSLW